MKKKDCPACKNENELEAKNCIKCEFPYNGSEKEKSIHIGKFISDRGVIVDSADYLLKSQRLLLIAAGMYLLAMIINFSFLLSSPIDLIFNIVIILAITISALFIKKSPLLFLIIPTVILTFISVIDYFIDPIRLMNGILFKLLVFGCLIYSIYIYLESNTFKKKYNIK